MALEPYDHVRLPDDLHDDDGVYRVVGRGGDTVALLHVADSAGQRVRSGRVVEVPVEEASRFVDASNPDDGFDPLNLAQGLYWSLRVPLERLR